MVSGDTRSRIERNRHHCMVTTPETADTFIERELNTRAEAVEDVFDADVLTFSGDLVHGIDDILRLEIEARKDKRSRLCVFLTTEGGYIEVVHRIVDLMRYHYTEVEFVVPNYAYSAGTVLVMSGDKIWMDYYSRLGPIDPQVEIDDRMVPASGYLIQYERLRKKAKEGDLTTAEALLIVSGFDQAELYEYEQARELSVSLLKLWLAKYKFKNWSVTETSRAQVTECLRESRAEKIARILNDTEKWHSHGHGISMDVLMRDLNLKIDDYGDDDNRNARIRSYSTLFADYRQKMGTEAVHSLNGFLPLRTN